MKTFKLTKIFISLIVVAIITIFTSLFLFQGFAIPTHSYHEGVFSSFYDEEKNKLDGVYIGASSVTRYWIPPLAFNETGIAVSSLATTSQPFVLTPYLMKEVKKTQNPKFFIIELRCAIKEPDYVSEKYLRFVTDNMKPSINRLNAIKSGLDFMYEGKNKVDGNELSVYFPALETLKRTMDNTLPNTDISFIKTPEDAPCKGFLLNYRTNLQKKVSTTEYNTFTKSKLHPKSEDALLNLLDYCDSIDNDVIFVLSPYSSHEDTYPLINTVIEIVSNRGYTVLNYNTSDSIEELNIDWNTDFYNEKHTNHLGAEKHTHMLTKYLKANYSLEDHRNDPDYSDWHNSYNNYIDYIK